MDFPFFTAKEAFALFLSAAVVVTGAAIGLMIIVFLLPIIVTSIILIVIWLFVSRWTDMGDSVPFSLMYTLTSALVFIGSFWLCPPYWGLMGVT